MRLLKTAKIERAIGEIDKYSGTTINDLKMFMQSHNLRFAAAKTPEEKLMYPELYASLRRAARQGEDPRFGTYQVSNEGSLKWSAYLIAAVVGCLYVAGSIWIVQSAGPDVPGRPEKNETSGEGDRHRLTLHD